MNTKAVYLFALAAGLLVTASGFIAGFNYETTWAYIAITLLVVGITIYNLITNKK